MPRALGASVKSTSAQTKIASATRTGHTCVSWLHSARCAGFIVLGSQAVVHCLRRRGGSQRARERLPGEGLSMHAGNLFLYAAARVNVDDGWVRVALQAN